MLLCLPRRRGAKCYCVVGAGTRERAGGIIVRVTIGFGTYGLENFRVSRRLASRRVTKRAVAAILRFPKRAAGALTRVAALHPQFRWATPIEILAAPRGGAGPRPASRRHHHRQIIAVDEAHVVVVHGTGAESELGESRRRGGSGAVAVDLSRTAVGGGAGPAAGIVELATGSAPESTGPTGRSLEASGTPLGEFKARGCEFRRA